MQLLISKCSQANGKWTDQFTRNWRLGIGYWVLGKRKQEAEDRSSLILNCEL